jgi:hypothetical protein
MFPVKNFISLATIRKGSTLTSPRAAAREVALEKTLDATETACAQLDCLLRAGGRYIELEISGGVCRTAN